MTAPSSIGDPIFILGIMRRSGTNFVSDSLRLHPDCGRPAPIWEDFVIHHADLLTYYVDSTTHHWREWTDPPEIAASLRRALGGALLEFLGARTPGKRLVTKTPSVSGLRHFFEFFPGARLLIIVRDGRAVIESAVRSFGGHFELYARRWAEAAKNIMKFDQDMKGRGFRYLIVKYEDFWSNPRKELEKIFEFLDLDARVYDFDAALNLPVRGSSTFGRRAGKVHWDPVARTDEFDPMRRWATWPRGRHERFNWIAGHYLKRFGYEEQRFGRSRFVWTLWNIALDMKWAFTWFVRSTGSSVLRRFHGDSPMRRRIPTILRGIGVE